MVPALFVNCCRAAENRIFRYVYLSVWILVFANLIAIISPLLLGLHRDYRFLYETKFSATYPSEIPELNHQASNFEI